jgi:hypothetical protein
MIFVVSEGLKDVEKVDSSSFVGLEIWERQHIEEWIRSTPEILGEELLIVSTEFDKFDKSNDRLDLLAIDRQGNLVVVELKRDLAAGYADLQAIRYAAMVSAMTIEKLLPHYVAYRRKHDKEPLSKEEAHTQIVEFVDAEDFEELSTRPRVILCSEDFSHEITTTVLWLRQSDIDIGCVKITPYQIQGNIVIVPTTIIPLQEAKHYLVDIQQKEERKGKNGRSRPKSMKVIVENGLVKAGEKIYLRNGLPDYMKYDLDDPKYHAEITGKLGRSNAVLWHGDKNEYSISKITWKIFRELHPDQKDPGGVNGNWHWVNEDGTPLWTLAEDFFSST